MDTFLYRISRLHRPVNSWLLNMLIFISMPIYSARWKSFLLLYSKIFTGNKHISFLLWFARLKKLSAFPVHSQKSSPFSWASHTWRTLLGEAEGFLWVHWYTQTISSHEIFLKSSMFYGILWSSFFFLTHGGCHIKWRDALMTLF